MASAKGGRPPPPPTTSLLHWHAHAVSSLAMSPDARYLFSGGEEGVLVVWQLGTGLKDFLPRLGAGITYLSSSAKEARVAVTTSDNTVRIINTASMKEDWEMRSLFIPGPTPKASNSSLQKSVSTSQVFTQSDSNYRCTIKVESRSGYIGCNGYPGQIQMLDLATQTFRTSHEIMQFTRVSKKESYSTMIVPSTTHFDYLDTQLGSLMVTVDVRRGEDSDADASLKFWEWDAEASVYRLSAQVDRPHGSARVTSAIFSPSSFQSVRNSQQQGLKAASSVAQTSSSPSFTCSCATSATDGSIKIWIGQSQQSSKDGSRSEANAVGMHWSCSFSFKHRDCLAGALSYSFDGSLLAISYENVVTLWDPSQVQLWRSIVAPTRHNVTFTAFIEPRASVAMGGGAGEAMLVVGASRSLSVYDLMTMKMMWSVEGYFSCFAVAANESAAVRCEGSSSSSKSSSLTWIAASVMKKNSRGTNYSEYTDMEGQSGKTIQGPNKILLFSCYSPKPLCVQKLRSTASSMTFWSNQRDVTSSLSSGLVVLTVQGEVLVVGASDALKQHFSDRSHPSSLIAQAKVFGQKLPTLPFSAVMHSYNQSSVESADGSDGMPPLPGPLSSSAIQVAGPAKGWLEGMFDSASGSIPPLSAIYGENTLSCLFIHDFQPVFMLYLITYQNSIISDDFVGGLLNKQQTGASEDSPQSSASTSSSSKAYAGPTSSGARSKVTKVDDESIFSGQHLSSANKPILRL